MVKVKCIVSDICEENGYVIWNEGASECVIVDPGFSAKRFLEFMKTENLTSVAAILCTHGHADHIAGIGPLREAFPEAKIVIGKKDAVKLTDSKKNLAHHFGVHLILPPADVKLTEDVEKVTFAGLDLTAYQTPGHAAGHVIYVLTVSEDEKPTAFVGDLIFYSGVGRTDFPDGNFAQLQESIRNIVYALPNETVLYSGHGPATTVGVERTTNPFVQG